ncbi:MAG TPA: hypothetical protein VGD02_08930 [Gemmatimonadaceae bacterium]
MAKAFSLPQQAQIVSVLGPATDAAGRTGAWFSLKNALKAYIVFHVVQGNAATILVSLLQASAVAGTGSKALVGKIWSDLDTATSDLLAAQTDASSYTTDAALKTKIVVFEVDPASLDVANAFNTVTISTGASNVANVTSAIAYVIPARYSGAPMPSAIVD